MSRLQRVLDGGQNRPGSLEEGNPEVGEEVSWAHEEREAGDMLTELTPVP